MDETTASRERLKQVREHVERMPDAGGVGSASGVPIHSGRRALAMVADGRGVARLDMTVVWAGNEHGGDRPCGCVIGVTASLFPEETTAAYESLAETGIPTVDEDDARTLASAAGSVLGLTAEQKEALFYGPGTAGDGGFDELEKLRPADVSRAIRRIQNGEHGRSIWDDREDGTAPTAGEAQG